MPLVSFARFLSSSSPRADVDELRDRADAGRAILEDEGAGGGSMRLLEEEETWREDGGRDEPEAGNGRRDDMCGDALSTRSDELRCAEQGRALVW